MWRRDGARVSACWRNGYGPLDLWSASAPAMCMALLMFTSLLLQASSGLAQTAKGERKVALVVGNAAYESLKPLDNPLNDAAEVTASLRSLGYQVALVNNASLDGLQRSIAAFRERLKGATVGLFYFSGHGFQTIRVETGQPVNHIVPVDFRFEAKAERLPSVPLDAIIDALRAEARVGLVFMDACRDDPRIAAEIQRTAKSTRGIRLSAGLSSLPAAALPTQSVQATAAPGTGPAGILVAYATDPGNVALDGIGDRLSPFTRALTTHMRTPGLSLSEIMGRVSADVARQTKGSQTPWNTSSLTAATYQFSVKPKPPAPPISGIGVGAGGITF